jgi:cobyrinic acid a,c-diamide synthase
MTDDRDQPLDPDQPLDLDYHGDQELAEGLVDLAVNVQVEEPPEWLSDVISGSIPNLAAYPNDHDAVLAIAAAHGVDPDQVLPTAGAAEGFTLLARALEPKRAVVVHPQFTVPDAALLAAGHGADRVVLDPANGFMLDPALVPDDADLVLVGNPTNPTSVLHPAARLADLLRPDRLLVVDEAFMDVVPGETETMISSTMTGLVVLRSLTKTWGLAGLRAGYAVGDPAVIARMRAQQPPWPVSAPALAAIRACLAPEARARAVTALPELDRLRSHLVDCLAEVGLAVVGTPQAPFVLVDSAPVRRDREPGWLRLALRDEGFAVRRGETFPGLGPDWIRIAVRDEDTTDRLVEALRRLVG